MRSLQINRSLWTLALGVTVGLTGTAPAQFGLAGGIGEAFRPAFTTRDVQLAVQMLRLDDAQKFILETLFEDYDSEFRLGVDGFRNNVSELRTQIDPNNPDPGQIMRVVFGTINEWRDESRGLADTLMNDLRGLLNEDQLQDWGPYNRKLFRLKYLKNGQLPGENLDLLSDVRELGLAEEQMAELQPLLEEYEQQLDSALRKREDYMQRSQSDLIEAIQEENYQTGLDVAARQVEMRKGVRNVNEQYTRTIASSLPTDVGPEFLSRIRTRTYPRVYRRTPAERAFDAAMKIEDLDAFTQEAVSELQQAYLIELESFNDRLVRLIRNQKPLEIQFKVEQAVARLSRKATERFVDESRAEFTKRSEISGRYMDQLKAVLTPEQFASLPGARRWIEPEPGTIAAAKKRALRAKTSLPPEKGGPELPLGNTAKEDD